MTLIGCLQWRKPLNKPPVTSTLDFITFYSRKKIVYVVCFHIVTFHHFVLHSWNKSQKESCNCSDVCGMIQLQEIWFHEIVVWTNTYEVADKSLAQPGRKQANVFVRMEWISFGAFPCKWGGDLMQLASRCCWNRARPWHASELVSFVVGLRIYQHPGIAFAARTH